jgi:hypothetical protein
MVRSLDNSNGIQYYGGNDPAKMGGRFKKGGSAGGGGGGGIDNSAFSRRKDDSDWIADSRKRAESMVKGITDEKQITKLRDRKAAESRMYAEKSRNAVSMAKSNQYRSKAISADYIQKVLSDHIHNNF